MSFSEVTSKDEFLNIKNVSRDDMLAAHRVLPQMMGIIPQNTGGFGDLDGSNNKTPRYYTKAAPPRRIRRNYPTSNNDLSAL